MDVLPDLFRVLLNAAMPIERQNDLGAVPHECTEGRTGHANGCKDKTPATRSDLITVAVPQVRVVNGQGSGFAVRSGLVSDASQQPGGGTRADTPGAPPAPTSLSARST